MSKSKILVLVLITFASSNMLAQTISMYKTFGGLRYTQSDTLITENQVKMILLNDSPGAYQEFKAAKKIGTISAVTGFAGGGLILIPVVTAVLKGNPEWGLAAGGAALLIASYSFNRVYKARALNALDIYNEKFSSRIKTNLYFTGTQAGLIVKF